MSTHVNWVFIDEKTKLLLPFVFILLLFYFYNTFISNIFSYRMQNIIEIIVLIYFSFEICVKYMISDSFRNFISNHWLKIILILPFLRIFRVFGFVGSFFRYVRFVPYIQKLAKIPKSIKMTKFAILLVLFKLSIIEKDKVKKEKEKIKDKD